MFLANPAGFWALLGIPAVLAIHFLQRKAREIPVSTLFLLARTHRESSSGRRWDRLVPSVPLWMQLLGVLLLAWLLAEPRFQRPRSVQRVAIVLDGTASMQVFRESLTQALHEKLPPLQGPAAELDLLVLESTPGRERLYHGSSIDDALNALESWNPGEGTLDPGPALRIARSLIGRDGILIFATDTPVENPPYDARLLAIGHPEENVGFTGLRFTQEQGAAVWHALVKNHGIAPAVRSWQITYPGGRSTEPRNIELQPGGLISLQAALPPDQESAILRLSEDVFTMDDSLPLVRPRPKTLRVFRQASALGELEERLVQSLDAVEMVHDAAEADLTLCTYDPLDPALPPGDAIVFVHDPTRAGQYLKGGIIAEEHPLMSGLNWQALLVRETIQLDRQPSDEVLLWQDQRPLIFLRSVLLENQAPHQQLCFNFDVRHSNATANPAFIVCLHRFAESVRQERVAPSSSNLETSQEIELTADPEFPASIEFTPLHEAHTTIRDLPASRRLRFEAPARPGHLIVKQADVPLLTAALTFADSREADLTHCGSADTLGDASSIPVERHTTADHWWRAWVLALLAALLTGWHFSRPRTSSTPDLSPSP
ncbi:BatA domain-containing protein [Haloferula luteola]|nr:BatA domain-containing protein [Haloferula luteola]